MDKWLTWRPMEADFFFATVFVVGLMGWNLFGAYADGIVSGRGGPVYRKKSPELFWFGTSVYAFVFGFLGVGSFLAGLGAPLLAIVAGGGLTTVAVIVAIARRPKESLASPPRESGRTW